MRVIDALAVYKDAAGEIEVEHLSNLTTEEAVELGTVVGALVGLGVDGEEGMGAARRPAPRRGRGPVFTDAEAWDVLEDIPNDSAAALLLLEHHWAVPLRDAVRGPAASGSATASSPRWTWSRIGLVGAEEAAELHSMETAAGHRSTSSTGWPARRGGRQHVRISQGRPAYRPQDGAARVAPLTSPPAPHAGRRFPPDAAAGAVSPRQSRNAPAVGARAS